MKTRDDAREREFPAGARREAGKLSEVAEPKTRQTPQNHAATPFDARREAGKLSEVAEPKSRQTPQNPAVTRFDARDLKGLLRPWRCVQVRGAGAF